MPEVIRDEPVELTDAEVEAVSGGQDDGAGGPGGAGGVFSFQDAFAGAGNGGTFNFAGAFAGAGNGGAGGNGGAA